MSPLWPESLRIGFAPGRVELVRRRQGLRGGRIVGERAVDCRPEPGQPPWTAALAALGALLAEEEKATDVAVTLSNRFARYRVVPWNPQLLAADELLAATRQHFEHVYGEAAAEWEIRVSPGEYGDPALACAVDRRLLAALEELVQRGGRRRLTAVEPALMRVFNASFRILDRDALLVLVEPDGVCVAALQSGRWHNVQTRHGPADERPALLAQEIALASADIVPSGVEFFDLAGGCDGPLPIDLPLRRHDTPGDSRLALAGAA